MLKFFKRQLNALAIDFETATRFRDKKLMESLKEEVDILQTMANVWVMTQTLGFSENEEGEDGHEID